jgi:hypothetical protein
MRQRIKKVIKSSSIKANYVIDDTEKRKLDSISKMINSGVKPEFAFKKNKLR